MKGIKAYIYSILCNVVTGSAIAAVYKNSIPDLRWKDFRFSVRKESVRKEIVASIFWGFYESAEIRFIEKYLDGDVDVVELGGSLGVVSSHIGMKLKDGNRLIIVEANPFLIDSINANVKRNGRENTSFEVLNYAVSYNVDNVHLTLTSDNTETRINKDQTSDTVSVKARSLFSILTEANVHDFSLVCDIEGSEIEILLNDDKCLRRCRQLFIELHDTHYKDVTYNTQSLKKLIEQKGFTLKDEHGPVCYYQSNRA